MAKISKETLANEKVLTTENATQSILDEIKSGIQDVVTNDIEIDNKRQNTKIQPDELIMCRSMTSGGFNVKCQKSGVSYRWNRIGDIDQVPYEDLYWIYTNKKEYLTKPNIIIEDERVINNFRLLPVYQDVASVNRLEQAINDVVVMENICKQALQVNMRDLIMARLSQLRDNKVLTNVDVIEIAEKTLKCEIIKK